MEILISNCFTDTIDCGIKVLKWCNTPWCRKLGTTTTFLTVLIILAIIQGICEKFIIISAHQAALEHDYDPKIIGTNFEINFPKRILY